jgi:hypothetical protein
MTSDTIPAQPIAAAAPWRPTLSAMVMAVMLLTSAFWAAGLAAPAPAQAASAAVDQCNSHGPATAGATTVLKCTVTVVNTISGTATSSTTTVTRLCTLGPCSTPNGTSTTSSPSLVTAVRQCNTSDNDAAHPITCSVTITNNIWRDTSGAQPLSAPTVTQCVGSGQGGLGVVGCEPGPVSGAMVTQCNGSGNGGGAVHCTVDQRSRVSGAVPIMVNQCNGSGNVGGSNVTCTASIITNITGPAVANPAPTTAAAPTTTPAATAPATPSPSESTIAAAVIVPNGAGPAAGPDHSGPVMLGSGLTLVAAVSALLYRRYAPKGFLSRLARKG